MRLETRSLCVRGREISLQSNPAEKAEQTTKQFVEVCVREISVGIPLENLPNIFGRFYCGDPARMCTEVDGSASSGSGLGLAIVKSLVEAIGEELRLRVRLGSGVVFDFGCCLRCNLRRK